jgi:predicted DCC family thiol-disulfide oxidoreductase YuxK
MILSDNRSPLFGIMPWRPVTAGDLPERLILFDGVCVLCAGWVRFVIARDPAGLYRFVPIQSEAGRALAQRFGIDADAPQSNAVVRGGCAWFKGDSVLQVWRDLPGWRWTGILRLVPRLLRNVVYDLVARNRYRLFGRRDACLVPTEDIRSRFVFAAEALAAKPRGEK